MWWGRAAESEEGGQDKTLRKHLRSFRWANVGGRPIVCSGVVSTKSPFAVFSLQILPRDD